MKSLSKNPLYNIKSKNKLIKLLLIDDYENKDIYTCINQYNIFITRVTMYLLFLCNLKLSIYLIA